MGKLRCFLFIITLLQVSKLVISERDQVTTPPLSILPLPSFSQLKWQERELIVFLHFGVNTFTNSEWGTGHENPAIFNPVGLNANQWVKVAAEAGFSLMILTAKHHDGFCLWPSKYTGHSVESSPWKNGHGDVVQELVNAAKNHGGIDVGLYLSPWDRHDKRYGNDLEYNGYYMAQLQELLNK
jgi:alpha-L-fucosidase